MNILALIIFFLILMVFEAVSISLVGWAFLDFGFWNAWHAAWDKPVLLFLFALVGLILKES